MKKFYYIIIIIVSSIFLSVLFPEENIKTLENYLLNVSTIFLGVAITLYGLTSTIILPIISNYKKVFKKIGIEITSQITGFSNLLKEIHQGIIVILIIFLISFLLPLIKSKFQILFLDDPECVIFIIKKSYISILFIGFLLIFFIIWDIIKAIKKLNELYLLLVTKEEDSSE